ncbi:MAG: hypothetical protein CFE44_12975, partial [Burkholderiales bacterium PBB4]
EGAARLDYRYWTVRRPLSPEVVWPEVGLGYGVNNRWYTELFMSYIGPNPAQAKPNTLNWQNDFLLTQGQYSWDVALHTNLVSDQAGQKANALEIGPVLQTDIGRVQINANLIFEQALGADTGRPPQLKFQWQAKYRWHTVFHWGLQGFGELGDWNRWSGANQQSHRWGPVVVGTLPWAAKQRLEYQAAYLGGSVYGSVGDMLSVRLQYVY